MSGLLYLWALRKPRPSDYGILFSHLEKRRFELSVVKCVCVELNKTFGPNCTLYHHFLLCFCSIEYNAG